MRRILAALVLLGAAPALAQPAQQPPAAMPPPQAQPAAMPVVTIVSDLGWSFRADVTIRNQSATQRIDAWTLVMDWPGRVLSQERGARMTASRELGRYTFEPPANAAALAPGASLTFTVAGTPGDAPQPGIVRFDAVTSPAAQNAASGGMGCRETPAGLSYSTDKTWDGGFTGRIDIVNKGAAPLADWLLTFTLDAAIGESWDGTVQSRSGNAYTVKPADYFKAVAPGATARFVFNAKPPEGATAATPTNLRLYGCG